MNIFKFEACGLPKKVKIRLLRMLLRPLGVDLYILSIKLARLQMEDRIYRVRSIALTEPNVNMIVNDLSRYEIPFVAGSRTEKSVQVNTDLLVDAPERALDRPLSLKH